VTAEIGFVLLVLAVSLVLFVTEWIRMDLVALLVLVALAVSGLVSPGDALTGFSNPAVITVWAMFMLSASLTATGVASVIGHQMMKLVGRNEARMVAVIMLAAGGMSAFMNNIGVAALMLPVVMDVARQTDTPPSRLLMPLAFGSLLGGLTTLVGTPPNLLISDALREQGLERFSLFDFTPVGGTVMVAGIAFVALAGRRWLPVRDISREPDATPQRPDLQRQYALQERAVTMAVPPGSPLAGRTLRASRLGVATGMNVIAVIRASETHPAPRPDFMLRENDRLVVEGRLDRLEELRGWRQLIVEDQDVGLEGLLSAETGGAELTIAPQSSLAGRTLEQTEFRRRFGAIVLAIRRDSSVIQTNLANTALGAGDRMLVQGRREVLEELKRSEQFAGVEDVARADLAWRYGLREHLFVVRVPPNSVLSYKSLARSRIGDALGLGVLGIRRGDRTRLMPAADERLMGDDRLLVRGDPDDLEIFRGLQQLRIEDQPPPGLDTLQSEQTALAEAMLSPRTALAGRTLRDLDFRDRYGLQVLAVFREGRSHRSDLGSIPLRLGDALLLFGRRDRLARLARDPDFLLLTEEVAAAPKTRRAPLAAAIMAAVLLPVLLGWLPISIAAVGGAVLMVLTGCLSMDEAYRAVEWRAIFLIAGMLPLGLAMEDSGAARYLAEQMLAVVGGAGPWGVLLGLYLLTAAATMIIPTAALVVLMAPIAIQASAEVDLSPQAAMMAVAISASASFTSPISHPANVLVMGPGGYRFADYLKLGVPLTLVVMVVALLVLPFFWPL